MASFKSHPLFSSMLLALGLVAVAEIYMIIPVAKLPYNRFAAKKKAEASLVQKQQELDALHKENPTPNASNKTSIEADLAQIIKARDELQAQLKGRGEKAEQLRAAPVPQEPTEAFFDITQFREATIKKFQEASPAIKIKEGERFGFSAYISTGPDKELIAQIFHQRQVAEYLLNSLLTAKPSAFVSIQREQPINKVAREAMQKVIDDAKAKGQTPVMPASDPSASQSSDPDTFIIDPRITARKLGFVDASAFRLVFIGETGVLRNFLNQLAKFELPLVVKSVEVDPSDPAPLPPLPPPPEGTVIDPAAAQPKPKVERLLSKFTVTVEYIDLVPEKSEATPK